MAEAGVLALWLDVTAEEAANCDEWYVREHIPDRMRVPGFRSARRYEALEAAPQTMAIYEADTLEAMLEPGYMGLVAQISQDSRRIRAAFRNTVRATLRITARAGFGEGAVAACLRFSPADAAQLRAWLCDTLLPQAVRQHCVVAAQFWEADRDVRARMDAVRAAGREDAHADWVLLLEATRRADLDAALASLLPPGALQAHGAAPGELRGLYTLLYAARPPRG